jgi:hypothetical protein
MYNTYIDCDYGKGNMAPNGLPKISQQLWGGNGCNAVADNTGQGLMSTSNRNDIHFSTVVGTVWKSSGIVVL